MSDELSAQIQTHFASLTDPRRRKVTYPLIGQVPHDPDQLNDDTVASAT
jgi:hypothetical protein